MKIINQTRDTVLADEAVVADTLFRRLHGLLGKKELKSGEGLLLKPCNSIHTFFMRFPIDVLFVNKEKHVIATISTLAPFRITPLYFQAEFAIELPAGKITSTLTSRDDVLQLIG